MVDAAIIAKSGELFRGSLYVNNVLDMAVNNTTAQPLAEYLTYLSTEIIQSTVSNERTCKVAELIFSIAHERAYYPDHAVITVD